ncbi:MAG: zinc-ribbon domain-containing protein, partial [Caldiserica bacterium]|nr:zinc-ribbon domain-containing protein [Caldisericota bacterium]
CGASLDFVECPKCGAKNPKAAKFCGECGTKLE